MGGFELTTSQTEAVETRGCPLLVSAAAGSGKTRVLTERLMARVAEGEDIDRFLVITFTRAAAAELKSRILTELSALSGQNPADRRLRRQTALLYRAQIGTIDSFCAQVVRQNAHLLGISPGFSMLDEGRGEELRAHALEDVLDAAYEHIDDDGGLRLLVDSAGAGRDDSRLSGLILELHDQMQSRAFPETWAREALEKLDVSGVSDAGQTPWGSFLLKDAAAEAAYRAEALDRAAALMRGEENELLYAAYAGSFLDSALSFRDFARACGEGWDKARSVLPISFPKLKPLRNFADEALKARVTAVRKQAQKAAQTLEKNTAGQSGALLQGIADSRPALEALMRLVFALDREFAARKRRADVCDFADLEHFCVKLVAGENGTPTALAEKLSGRFAEVMVDEYQDVNAVQDLIFRCVSDGGKKLFLVGDVKQSIYRFRLADPGIFNAKSAEFASSDGAKRILLRENFRSRRSVLDAVNSVFEKLMSPALGDVEYGGEARLEAGASYPNEGEIKPELCVVPLESDGDGETPDKTLAEARVVASRIRSMVDGGERVTGPDGRLRPVSYGDIAVLLRAPSASGAAYRRAMLEAGVPVNARQGGAFFEQPEVRFAVSMLAAADNPRQDVPLIAALRGAPFGFTPDELTGIRAAAAGDFWTALCAKAKTDQRCAEFVSVLNELRDLAREEPTDGLLRRLYERTGLMALCCAMPDGQARCANLMQLYEYARKFEQDGYRGLFRFVGWLRELEEKGEEPPTHITGEAVQLMSIHKSKGLEFPGVFLADNAHGWAGRDAPPVLLHEALGVGMRMTDARRGVDWPTLPWRAIREKKRIEELSEQLRVLYVAMTRARERLIMTCGVKDAENLLERLETEKSVLISPRVLATASSPAQWLLRAAVCDGGRTIDLKVVRTPEGTAAQTTAETPAPATDPALVEMLAEKLSWTYPYAGAVELPSKLTATEIKGLETPSDPEAMQAVPPGEKKFREPDFGKADSPLSGAERGIAAHLVMQHIDFVKTGDRTAVASEIERLRQVRFLDDRQAAAVDPEDILAFFCSDIGRRALAAERVMREFRFSLLCPAQRWFKASPEGEQILLQGVVDLCLEEHGALTIVDFKTDAEVEPERYAGQLGTYAYAMERIVGKPVTGAVLWYLRRRTQKSLL
jgi:ATP-dependent helicase/nuclease subunit A